MLIEAENLWNSVRSFDIIPNMINERIRGTLEEAMGVLGMLKSLNEILKPELIIRDSDALEVLMSNPKIYGNLVYLADKVREFLKNLGFEEDDFRCEVSRWEDIEIEGWGYLQFEVILSDKGRKKLYEMRMDEFELFDRLAKIADEVLPPEVRQDVIVSVD
jgi:hypothetical protein